MMVEWSQEDVRRRRAAQDLYRAACKTTLQDRLLSGIAAIAVLAFALGMGSILWMIWN